MRSYILASLPVAAILLSGQSQPVPVMPSAEPDAQIVQMAEGEAAHCAEVIQQVRDANALTTLQRGPATPEDGYLIAAVDKRVDGCSVMQMHGDVSDLRPLPEPAEETLLWPAEAE